MSKIFERWSNAEAFYLERDNRTMLEVKELADYVSRPVEIHLDPAEAHTATVQQIALLACNLTSRWARRISVVTARGIPLSDQLKRDGFEFLEQRIIKEMRSSDPFGNFQIVSPDEFGSEFTFEKPLRLFIGSWANSSSRTNKYSTDDYFVNARGWTASGRRGSQNLAADFINCGEDAFAASAGLAASIGVADLFKRAVGHSPENLMPDFAWNLWSQTYTSDLPVQAENYLISNSTDLGRTLLAGVGAIGSALVYLLDMTNLSGHLTLLDRDRVELSNLNRSPLFNIFHVLSDEYKTAIAEQYLQRHNLNLKIVNGTWHESAPHLTLDPYDVWISFTNEDAAWAEVPFQLPPVVLHGTTTSGWGFGAGRHIPRRDDCTLCRLPRPEAVFRGPCAEGEIESEIVTAPARASLPFLSAASASLVLAELVKLNSPKIVHLPNDVAADLKTGLPAVINLIRSAKSNCRGCRAASTKLWEMRGGRGRYRRYSKAA